MAIKVLGWDGVPFDSSCGHMDGSGSNFIFAEYQLVFSGSYATGGDTLDFTNAGVNSAVPPGIDIGGKVVRVSIDSNGGAASQGGIGGYFQFIPGTTLLNGKLKVFSAAGVELAAGAYPAAVTGDLVLAEVVWKK